MAVIGTIGQDVATANYTPANYTYIDKRNPATAKGKIYAVKLTVTASGTATIKLKIFRINGSNYDVVSDQTFAGLTTGENTITLTTPVNILVGDLIGMWTGAAGNSATLGYASGTGTGHHSLATTDVTGTTPIASFSAGAETLDIVSNIMSVPGSAFMFFL